MLLQITSLLILNDRAMDTIVNPRLLSIKERTLTWQYDMVYVASSIVISSLQHTRCPGRKVWQYASLSSYSMEKKTDTEDMLHADADVSLMEASVVPCSLGQEDSVHGVAGLCG